jgi:hypothetical protein
MTPACIVQHIMRTGWGACAVFIWIIVLFLGRMPQPLIQATAASCSHSRPQLPAR